jgi:hypothetical protein
MEGGKSEISDRLEELNERLKKKQLSTDLSTFIAVAGFLGLLAVATGFIKQKIKGGNFKYDL